MFMLELVQEQEVAQALVQSEEHLLSFNFLMQHSNHVQQQGTVPCLGNV